MTSHKIIYAAVASSSLYLFFPHRIQNNMKNNLKIIPGCQADYLKELQKRALHFQGCLTANISTRGTRVLWKASFATTPSLAGAYWNYFYKRGPKLGKPG